MQAIFIYSLGYAGVTQEGKQEDVHPQADVSNLIKKPEFCGNKNVGILLHSWGVFTNFTFKGFSASFMGYFHKTAKTISTWRAPRQYSTPA